MEGGFGGVLVAAGSSSRMGGGRSKVLALLKGRPVFCWSLQALLDCEQVKEICVVCRPEDQEELARLSQGLKQPSGGKRVRFTLGGDTRQASVYNGVLALEGEWPYVVVHDGARPLVRQETLEAVCQDAAAFGAATAAVPSKDTCKLSGKDGFVESTPPRERLMAVQTPQAFRRELYLYAAEKARQRGESYTDDCQLIEAAGGRVRLTPSGYENFKLTTPEDLLFARAMVGEGRGQMDMRIGSGYDVHRLVADRRLILGGVDIPFEKGLLGHSDADVLCHAIADALLGAAALGDIGCLFPDSDPQYKGADSLKLLSAVCRAVEEAGYRIGNIDATVMAQRPKLAPYVPQMRENIARACGIDVSQVSVKATTEEGMGFTGREEGMAAQAVCLLDKEG